MFPEFLTHTQPEFIIYRVYIGFFSGTNALESTPVKCRKIDFTFESRVFASYQGLNELFSTDFVIHCNFLVQKKSQIVEKLTEKSSFWVKNRVFGFFGKVSFCPNTEKKSLLECFARAVAPMQLRTRLLDGHDLA